MKLEFWSDTVCPWCGLAEHRLAHALGQFEHGDDVNVIHRSFQTHPDIDRNGVTQRRLLALHGIDPRAADTILGPIERLAAAEGLQPYKTIDRILGPTNFAHELLAHATANGVTDAWSRMFRAHFGNGLALWTIEQVVDFASELGLDRAAAHKALEAGTWRGKVDDDQRAARNQGATGVPFIVINDRHVIAGAQTAEALLAILRRLWSQRAPTRSESDNAGPTCTIAG